MEKSGEWSWAQWKLPGKVQKSPSVSSGGLGGLRGQAELATLQEGELTPVLSCPILQPSAAFLPSDREGAWPSLQK